jgi:hypothetical protein
MNATPTIYFIELNPPGGLPMLVEVHKSFDGAADAIQAVKEQLQVDTVMDSAYERIKATTAGVALRSRDEYKEVFDSARILSCEATEDNVADLLIEYGMNDRRTLDAIIIPPFMQFVAEAPVHGYMTMSDVYAAFAMFSNLGASSGTPGASNFTKDVN